MDTLNFLLNRIVKPRHSYLPCSPDEDRLTVSRWENRGRHSPDPDLSLSFLSGSDSRGDVDEVGDGTQDPRGVPSGTSDSRLDLLRLFLVPFLDPRNTSLGSVVNREWRRGS